MNKIQRTFCTLFLGLLVSIGLKAQDLNVTNNDTVIVYLTVTNFTGTAGLTNGAVFSQGIPFTGQLRSGKGGFLSCVTYISHTNTPLSLETLITKMPLTAWNTNSGAANLASTDILGGYILGTVKFATNDFSPFGTNQVASQQFLSLGLAGTNYLYIKCNLATTNVANDLIKLTIDRD